MIRKFHFTRFEIKYYLDKWQHRDIADRLLSFMRLDDYASSSPGNYYSVSSIYFDSQSLSCFRANQVGLKNRFKLRIRNYDNFKNKKMGIFFEIKEKKNMMVIKDRSFGYILKGPFFDTISNQWSNQKMQSLIGVLKGLQLKENLNKFQVLQALKKMKPVVLIGYNRQPLVSLDGRNLRVTFDYDIYSMALRYLDSRVSKNSLLPGGVIMEIKFSGSLPYWINDIIKGYQLNRIPFSKYCQGILKEAGR